MDSWMNYELISARHQERLREAAASRLAHAVVQARQEPPAPLLRLTGSALTAAGDRLIALGRRLQTDPPAMAWSGLEDERC